MTSWEWLQLAAKTAMYGGYMALAGGLLVAFLAPNARRFCARYMAAGALLGLLSAGLLFLFQVGSFAEAGAAGMFDRPIMQFLWDTAAGTVAALRGLAFVLALLVAPAISSRGVYRFRGAAAVTCVAILLQVYCFTLIGHSTEASAMGRLVLAVHVVAAALWIGALVPLWWLCRHMDLGRLGEVMARFGRWIGLPLGLLLGAGALLFHRLSGGQWWVALQSPWGIALTIKVSLVSGLLVVAVLNRWALVPRLGKAGCRQTLARAIHLDLYMALGLLAATAFLTTLVGPPGH